MCVIGGGGANKGSDCFLLLFSLFSDGDTSNSSTGILWSNIYITMGISPESLGSDLCCEDADESVEPAAHLETKCVNSGFGLA